MPNPGSRNSMARSRVIPLKLDAGLADELDGYVKTHGGNRNATLRSLVEQLVHGGPRPERSRATQPQTAKRLQKLPRVDVRVTPPLQMLSDDSSRDTPSEKVLVECDHPAAERKTFSWGTMCGVCKQRVR